MNLQLAVTRSLSPLIAAGLICLAALPSTAQEGASQAAPDEAVAADIEALAEVIRVIQQRPILRTNRLEVQTLFGVGLSDTMFRHMAPILNMRFHIDERWSVGASGAYYFPDTHGYDYPLSTTSPVFDDVAGSFEVFPEKAVIEWSAGVDAAFIPVDGKFALFNNHILYFDFYLLAGGGVLQTSRSATPRPMGMVGLGWRLTFNRWLAMTLEFRDHLYVESYNAGSEFVNHVMFQAGFSWWFPVDFEYRFPR